MSEFYDKKNEQDFNDNTDRIWAALDKIRSNKNLKATTKVLSELSGMHRNSFGASTRRAWALEELQLIKAERSASASASANEMKMTTKDQIGQLESNLAQAKKEIIYWFAKYSRLQEKNRATELDLTRRIESLDWYKKELKKERDKSETLQALIKTDKV